MWGQEIGPEIVRAYGPHHPEELVPYPIGSGEPLNVSEQDVQSDLVLDRHHGAGERYVLRQKAHPVRGDWCCSGGKVACQRHEEREEQPQGGLGRPGAG